MTQTEVSGGHGPDLTFTEPNLAWQLVSLGGDVVTIRVFVSLESAPPWVDEDNRGEHEQGFDLRTTRAIAAAARDWLSGLQRFPMHKGTSPCGVPSTLDAAAISGRA